MKPVPVIYYDWFIQQSASIRFFMTTSCNRQQQLAQISKQLEASVDWRSKNAASMDFHRVEGTLDSALFQKAVIEAIVKYEDYTQNLSTGFACGFEIEFYLEPHKVALLENQFADLLPDYQMLLIDLESVPKTNHRNFYLIKENTGLPPEGMSSYEIVSPILDYKSLPYFISEIISLLQNLGAQDNDSIGFHLHISTLEEIKISPISLLYFLDENGVLNHKERKYSRDIIGQFFSYSPKDWQWIFEEVTRKCYNVNLLHYDKQNHIELRSIGGAGYLENPAQLLETCFNSLIAYQQAISTPSESVAQSILETYSMQKNVLQTRYLSVEDLKKTTDNDVWFV